MAKREEDGIDRFAKAQGVPREVVEAHIQATAMQFGIDPGLALALAASGGIEAFNALIASAGNGQQGVREIGGVTHRPAGMGDIPTRSYPPQQPAAVPVTSAGRGDSPPPPTAQDRRHALARRLVADRPKDAAMIDAMLGGRR